MKRSGLLWLGFLLFHLLFMAVDWQLRDQGSGEQPMPGGIPMGVGEIMSFASLLVFAVAVFWWQPSRWNWASRVLLGVLQIVLAFVIMIFAHLYYGLNWGIDTL